MYGRLHIGGKFQGDSGSVYRLVQKEDTGTGFTAIGEKLDTGMPVFVKQFVRDRDYFNRYVEQLFYKSELHNVLTIKDSVEHVNIPGVVDTNKTLGVIVYDYIRGVSLDTAMSSLKNRVVRGGFGNVGMTGGLTVLGSTARTVRVFHEVGVTHGDLKPKNIILDERLGYAVSHKVLVLHGGRVFVCDFELSSKDGSNPYADVFKKKEDIIGTPSYMSPEQVRGEIGLKESDVFTLGIIGYDMLVPRGFFNIASPLKIREYVNHLQNYYGPPAIEKNLFGMEKMLQAMVEPRLENRPTMAEVEEGGETALVKCIEAKKFLPRNA